MKKSLLFVFVLAMVARGENATTSTTVAPASEAKTIGILDMRPQYSTKLESYNVFSEAALGYRFNKDLSLSYFQWFAVNLYDPASKANGMTGDDGFVKFKANNLFTSGGFQIAYENRLVLPVKPSKVTAGMILEDQNRIKFIQKLNPITLTVMEIPIMQFYERPYFSDGKSLVANPGFQNRVYLIIDWSITERLALSVPFQFFSTKYREYDGAAKSGTWAHALYLWPEILYAITPTAKVGVAYLSNSIIASDFSDTRFGNFHNDALMQAVVQLTL